MFGQRNVSHTKIGSKLLKTEVMNNHTGANKNIILCEKHASTNTCMVIFKMATSTCEFQ